jgi:hypothetical protein
MTADAAMAARMLWRTNPPMIKVSTTQTRFCRFVGSHALGNEKLACFGGDALCTSHRCVARCDRARCIGSPFSKAIGVRAHGGPDTGSRSRPALERGFAANTVASVIDLVGRDKVAAARGTRQTANCRERLRNFLPLHADRGAQTIARSHATAPPSATAPSPP